MHNPNTKTHYLKEYSCFQIKYSQNSKPVQERKIEFSGKQMEHGGAPQLPTQIIDKNNQVETLYFLKWNIRAFIHLDIFVFSEEKFVRIVMNMKPIAANITDNYLYLVGGGQIYIINLSNLHTDSFHNLNSKDCLFGIEPAFFQKEYGMILYTWNEGYGFKSRRFSPNYAENDISWLTNLSSMVFRKKVQAGFLKIVIPNILGLIFLSEDTFCLYDLYNMKIIEHTKRNLTDWKISKPENTIVKYHQNMRSHGFDDSILISIGEGSQIQLLVVHISYDIEKKEEFNLQDQEISQISHLTNGYLISWDRSQIAQYFTIFFKSKLIDYLLIADGVIYFCEQHRKKIPLCEFVHYLNPLIKYPILTLENNIWNQFNIDKKIQLQLLKGEFPIDRLCIPNRYSIQFLYKSSGVSSLEEMQKKGINQTKLLIDWAKSYKMNNLLIYRSDILLVRDNSISTFLQITQTQYRTQLNYYFEEESINDSVSGISVISQNEQNPDEDREFCYGFTYDRCLDHEKHENKEKSIFAGFLEDFERRVESPNLENSTIQGFIDHKSEIFSKQLIVNRLKDIILFYAQILTSSFMSPFKNDQSGIDYQFSPDEQLIIHYLNFFSRFLCEPAQQIKLQGLDSMQLFINMHRVSKRKDGNSELVVNIDKECWTIIRKLFQDIIPKFSDEKNHYNSNRLNQFVKLLIDSAKKQVKSYQKLSYFGKYLYEMFSYLFTRNPNSMFLSNTIFYSTFFMHFSSEESNQFQFIQDSYCLRVINQIKQCKTEYQSEIVHKFMKTLKKWGITKEKTRKIRACFTQFLKSLQMNQQTVFGNRNSDLKGEQTDNSIKSDEQEQRTTSGFKISSVNKLSTRINLINLPIIESYLAQLTEKEVQKFFSMNLDVNLVLARNNQNERNELYYKQIEELICGWALFYRTYANRFNKFIDSLNETEDQEKLFTIQKTEELNEEKREQKKKANFYIKNCIKGYNNCQFYKSVLLGKSDRKYFGKLEDNYKGQFDNELFPWIGQVFIFKKLGCIQWLQLISQMLYDEFFETFTKVEDICFFHLDRILLKSENNSEEMIKQLKKLHKYFSKSEISRTIGLSTRLAKAYQQMDKKVKAFFGYTNVNMSLSTLQFVSEMRFRNSYIEAQARVQVSQE